MAPLTAEPGHIVVVLDSAGREALHQLVGGIAAHMRSQLELRDQGRGHTEGDAASRQAPEQPTTGGGEEEAQDPQRTETHASDADLIALQKSALAHFDGWRENVLSSLVEILDTKNDDKLSDERKKREERISQTTKDTVFEDSNLLAEGGDTTTDNATQEWAKAVEAHHAIYQPIPTSLGTRRVQDRMELLSAILLLLLSTGIYSSYSRTMMVYLTSALGLPLSVLNREEKEIATTMIRMSSEAQDTTAQPDDSMPTEEEIEKQRQQNRTSRLWKVGLASVAGAAALGVTGGLAGPVVAGAVGGLMGSVGLGGLASFLGVFWTKGALVGTLFGAFGAGMTGNVVDKYAREVQDFKFLPLKKETNPEEPGSDTQEIRRLRVTVGINGWLLSEDEVCKPWRVLGDDTEAFALRYEIKRLLNLGQDLQDTVASHLSSSITTDNLPRDVLATLGAALWPIPILKSAAGIDTPFDLAKNRSKKAGQILAEVLIDKIQGERPVTLVGYSLGARVIYSCLKTLAERRAFGLVETVVFIGAAVPTSRHHWRTMRSVIAGKMFNVFSREDYLLAWLTRASIDDQDGAAGLQAVAGIDGLVNIDVSAEFKDHLQYPKFLRAILSRCGIVDVVESMKEQSVPSEEEIGPAAPHASSEQRSLESCVHRTRVDETPTGPVMVKPLSKRSHRRISFPSGISTIETPPVVQKVRSVAPASRNTGRRSSLPNDEEGLVESSSQGAFSGDADSVSARVTRERSRGDDPTNCK